MTSTTRIRPTARVSRPCVPAALAAAVLTAQCFFASAQEGAEQAPTKQAPAQSDAKKKRSPRKAAGDQGSAQPKARMAAAFPEYEHVPDIVFKTVDGAPVQLDLLLLKPRPAAPAPLLLYIHGGGWGGGDRYRIERSDISGVYHRCAKAGIMGATVEYRRTDGKATAFDSVVDCHDALRFLVKNAKQYGINPARIGTIGGSAGGHLSLVTALSDPKDFPGDPALAGFDPPALRCEVAYYPATDFTDPALAQRFIGDNRATKMFGGPAEEKADVIRLLSPVLLLRKDSTPVYVFHGDQDKTLPVDNARKLFQKGQELGADIRYTEVKNGGHGFSGDCSPTIDEICELAAQFVIEKLTR